jgi:hypothetical protein
MIRRIEVGVASSRVVAQIPIKKMKQKGLEVIFVRPKSNNTNLNYNIALWTVPKEN